MADLPPEDQKPAGLPGEPSELPTLIDAKKADPLRTEKLVRGERQLTGNQGFDANSLVAMVSQPLDRLADYELIAEIARGGMGVVFQARHVHLHRLVALKMVLGGNLAREENLSRFRTEAEAAAQLQHPGIVSLYEVGTHDGQPFITMEFVKGTSLAQIAAKGPISSHAAATYLEKTARAVHFAHVRGILHRDLKPANVLVDEHDQPKVTDFGLAKLLQTDSGQTGTGVVIGTPSYMAPEQAAASKDLGPECDVYSLGAILYELLTSRPPFRGETALATLTLLAEQDPVSPRLLNPKIDADLETICLKCLEKEPSRRYRSAEAMADDLQRYLDGEPIAARRVGTIGRAIKWCRRKPAAAALLLVSSVAGLVLAVGGFVFAAIEHDLLEKAQREHARAVAAQNQANVRAEGMRGLLYLAQIHLARHAWDDANLDRVEDLLVRWRPEESQPGQKDVRGWEWYFLNGLCRGKFTFRGHTGPVTALAFRPDGKLLATAGTDRHICLWETATGRLIGVIPQAHSRRINSLAFNDRGNLLASGSADNMVKVWNPATRRIIHELQKHRGNVTSVCFSRGGNRLASSSWDGSVVLWDVKRGVEIKTISEGKARLNCVRFSPDGLRLAAAGGNGQVFLWEGERGRFLRVLNGHAGEVMTLAFSHDSQLLASGGGWGNGLGEVRLWSMASGLELRPRYGHNDRVLSLAFSPDGKLAVGGPGGIVRVWNTAKGSEAFSFRGDAQIVWALAFNAPDGSILAAAGQGGAVRLWNSDGSQGETRLEKPGVSLNCLAITPNNKILAAGGGLGGRKPFGEVNLWNLATGKLLSTLRDHTNIVRCLAASPDGQMLASGGDDHCVRIYRLDTRKLQAVCRHDSGVVALAISPDGKTVATACHDELIYLWDTHTGKRTGVLKGHTNYVLTLAYSPDGKRLASGSYDKSVKIWDVKTRELKETLVGHERLVNSIAFSPSGHQLVSGSYDKTVRLWDLETGRFYKLEGSAGKVTSVIFSADGLRIICGAQDRKIHLWDVVTQQEILNLEGAISPVKGVAMSSNNRWLASVDSGSAVHLWEAEYSQVKSAKSKTQQ